MQSPQQICDKKKYSQNVSIFENLIKYFEILELRNEIFEN